MLKIASCQLNFTVGDITGNIAKINQAYIKAKQEQADLVIFSEMAITGYPAEDLVLFSEFQNQAKKALVKLTKITKNGPAIIVGNIDNNNKTKKLYNTAFFIAEGKIIASKNKINLPNYGIFDEKRVFTPGQDNKIIKYKNINYGLLICEDIWVENSANELKKQGADIIISINASPYELNKDKLREKQIKNIRTKTNLPIIYVNQIGGQDEVVFDGGSFILPDKNKIIYTNYWQENISYSNWQKKNKNLIYVPTKNKTKESSTLSTNEHILNALKLGLKDYIEKNNFKGVIIGMSGGIDSAISAYLAKEALGKNKVRLVMLPYIYTSKESIKDAKECANNLGINLEIIDIKSSVDNIYAATADLFKDYKKDITEENIQARIRGLMLMALSNKFGLMVLTTGNKSEMATGYATLYGDMCGGFNLLKDLYKTKIYELAKFINKKQIIIPTNILTKPATAELRPNQTDQDSLPAYEILDKILYELIEERSSIAKTSTKLKLNKDLVQKIALMLKNSEYKRRQAAPGVKISKMAFGRDRRQPITNGFL